MRTTKRRTNTERYSIEDKVTRCRMLAAKTGNRAPHVAAYELCSSMGWNVAEVLPGVLQGNSGTRLPE